jgi:hypothetical protein
MALPRSKLGFSSTPVPAYRFYRSVGICTHPNWRDTLWGRTNWESAFLGTGVRNLRGKIGSGPTGKAALADLQSIFAAGAKICVTIAENDGTEFDLRATKASLDFLADAVGPENICGIESANEYNSPKRRPADWARKLRGFQAWLHETVRSNAAFDSVPLIAPSIWGRLTSDYRALGNLLPNVDRGCIHFYTGGRRPSQVGVSSYRAEAGSVTDSSLQVALADARTLAPGRPLWMTEFGYSMTGPGADTRGDVPERVAAKYLLRGLFDIFAQGVEKTFIYSLLDDVDERPPRYHGLMDGALVPRQSYHSLRNLMSLFRDESLPRGAVPPGYRLSGGTPRLKQHVFQKNDGDLLIIMYQDVDSYDRSTRRELKVEPEHVRLALNERAEKIELFDPGASEGPFRTIPEANSVAIPVSDAVVAVKVSGRQSGKL